MKTVRIPISASLKSFRQSIPKDGKDTKQGKTVSSETNSITTTATSN